MSEPYTRILLDTAADSPGHPATLYTDIRYSTVQYSTVQYSVTVSRSRAMLHSPP